MNTFPKYSMKKTALLSALLMIMLLGTMNTRLFAQIINSDNCTTSYILCDTDELPSTETTVDKKPSGTPPGPGPNKFLSPNCGVAGSPIWKDVYYHFHGYKGGSTTIDIANIVRIGNSTPILYAEVFAITAGSCLDDANRQVLDCGKINQPTGALSFTVTVQPDKDYYVVLGYSSDPGPGAGHTFGIKANNNTSDAITGHVKPLLTAAQCYSCIQDRNITFTNLSEEKSENDVVYRFDYSLTKGSGYKNAPKGNRFTIYPSGSKGNNLFSPAKNPSSPDTIIDVVDMIHNATYGLDPSKKQNDMDSIYLKIYAQNICSKSLPPTESVFYIQKNDARYDTLAFSKCNIATIPYFIQFPYRPSLNVSSRVGPCFPPGRDSIAISKYVVKLHRPDICGLPDTLFTITAGITPGHFTELPYGSFNSKYSDQFNVNVRKDCYGIYTTKVYVFGGCYKNITDTSYAYDSKGYVKGYDPFSTTGQNLQLAATQDTAQHEHKTVLIPPPPKVKYLTSYKTNLFFDAGTSRYYLPLDQPGSPYFTDNSYNGYRTTDTSFCSYTDTAYVRFDRTTRRGLNKSVIGGTDPGYSQIPSGTGKDWRYKVKPIQYKGSADISVVGAPNFKMFAASDYTQNPLDDSVWVMTNLPGFAGKTVRHFYFELTTIDEVGFCSIDTFSITLKPIPQVEVINDSVTVCGSGSITFKTRIVSGIKGSYSYNWAGGKNNAKLYLPEPPFPTPPVDSIITTKVFDAAVDTSVKKFTLWIQDNMGCSSLDSPPLPALQSDSAYARVWTSPKPRVLLDSTIAFCVGQHQNTRHLKITVLNLDSAARKANAVKSDFNYYWFLPSISLADPDVTLSNNPNKDKDTITVFKLSQTSTRVFIDVTTKPDKNRVVGSCVTRDSVRWVKVKRPVLKTQPNPDTICERDKFGRTNVRLNIFGLSGITGSFVRNWPSYPNYGLQPKCFTEGIVDDTSRTYDFKYHSTGPSCQPGVYNYRIAVADPIHCDVDTIINKKLTVSPAPKFKFTYSEGGPVVCKGQRIVINASGADVNSYVWSIGQYRDYSDTLNLLVDYPDVSKTYIDTVSGSLQGFCALDTTISLTVLNKDRAPKLANVANDFDHNCENTSRVFNILNYNGSLKYAFWLKANNGGQANCTNCSDTNNIVYKPGQSSVNIDFIKAINPTTSAFFTLYVRSLNASGCLSKDTAYIIQLNPIPVSRQLIPLNRDAENDGGVCVREVKTYIEPTNGSTYAWNLKYGLGTVAPFAATDSIHITWNTAGTDTLKVQETSVWGCIGDTVKLPIKVNPLPTVNFTPPANYCQDSVLILKAIPVPNPLPAGLVYNYTWHYITSGGLSRDSVTTVAYYRGDSLYVKVRPNASGLLQVNVRASNVLESCSGDSSAYQSINIEPRSIVTIDRATSPALGSGSGSGIPTRVFCQGAEFHVKSTLSGGISGQVVTNPWYLDTTLMTKGAKGYPTGQFLRNLQDVMNFKAGTNPQDTGVYVFRYTTFNITPTFSCSPTSDTVMVHIRPAFNASMNPTGNKVLCQGEEVNFINTKILNAHYGKIEWSARNVNTGSNPLGFSPSINDSTPIYRPKPGEFGLTTIKLKILNAAAVGCPSDSSNVLVVDYSPRPVAKIRPITLGAICASTPLQLDTIKSVIPFPTNTYVKWVILSPLSPGENISVNNSIVSPTYYAGTVTKKKLVTIQLTVLSPNCPSAVSDPISFYVYPENTADAGLKDWVRTGDYVKLCQGDTLLDLSLDQPSVGGGYTSLRWSASSLNPSGQLAASPINNPTVLLPQKFALNPSFIGDFAIVLTAMNGVCADYNDTIRYRVFELPTVKITPSSATICQGTPYVISSGVTVTPSGATFKWSSSVISGSLPLGTFNPTNNVPTTYKPDPQEYGDRLLTLTATNGVCPTRSGSITLTISAKPSITGLTVTPKATVCYAHEVRLGTVITNPQNFKFEWTPANSVNDPNLQNVIATPSANTTYSVKVTDKLGLNCYSTKDTVIIVVPRPTIDSFTPSELCVGDKLTLKGSIPAQATGGKWSTTTSVPTSFNNDQNVGTTIYTPTEKDTLAEEVIVRLQALNPYCVDLYSLVQRVKLNPTPTIDAGVDMEISQGQTVQLDGKYKNNGFAKWTTDGTGRFVPDSLARNTTYEPSDEDYVKGKIAFTYTLMLGCASGKADKMLVKIKNISASNAISANNDKLNDYLEFKGLPENSRLKVFDKWGRLVYETPSGSYYNNDWDGDNLPGGVYYYVLTYRLGNQHGWVEIFK